MEISFSLVREHWGCGYATEALSLALERAFSRVGIPRIIAETQTKNLRSIRLLERVGMLPQKRLVRFGEEQVIYGIDAKSFGLHARNKPE